MANERSKTEFLTAMEGYRKGIFKDPFKVSAGRRVSTSEQKLTSSADGSEGIRRAARESHGFCKLTFVSNHDAASHLQVAEFGTQVHETCTTVWGETFETDIVILATFSTESDGKLRISSFKQFLDGFHVTKMGDAMKANGIVMPST